MKVVIINKSDTTGGAAVVSTRLLLALRNLGVDASMIVAEKLTDYPFVHTAAPAACIRIPFLAERLKIYIANGFERDTLFKIDTASDGVPLWRHPLVREADVICLNWVNQGLLSLSGLRRLLALGKPVVWTMHDMWNLTGICHHAGACRHWTDVCGDCPLLGGKANPRDLSFRIHKKKSGIYQLALRLSRESGTRLHFVAVSNWLASLARESSLLREMPLSVIPNAFPVPETMPESRPHDKFRILMGAARLDDPVKGLPILVEATKILKDRYPEESKGIELVTFGNVRNPDALNDVALNHCHLGVISGEENLRRLYSTSDAVVSTSLYETLPGTLVEGLVYGCIPVSFSRGGQKDIVDHLSTGYLAEWSDDLPTAAARIAEGIIWATRRDPEAIRARMYAEARARFDAPVVASRYLALFRSLL